MTLKLGQNDFKFGQNDLAGAKWTWGETTCFPYPQLHREMVMDKTLTSSPWTTPVDFPNELPLGRCIVYHVPGSGAQLITHFSAIILAISYHAIF